ncbi:MAG: hypothetical protein KC996_00845 [Phycisphaerales bacterium]|nr:hypothetical protein [Phycisphaerales bacterium]
MVRSARRGLFAITLGSVLTSAAFAEVSMDDARLLCTELGITPEVMAILDMNATATQAAFDRIDDNESVLTSLRAVQDQRRSAMQGLKQARKSVRIAETDAEASVIQARIDQYELDLASYAATIETLQDQLRDDILPSTVDSGTVALLCEPAGLYAVLPAEYRVASLQESDFGELLSALSVERRAINNNETVPTEVQLTLSQYRSIPAVQTARSNISYNLDAVKSVYYD